MADFQFMFRNALESRDPQLYDTKFPELMARQIVPTISGVDPLATLYTYELLTPHGEATPLASRGTDLTSVDLDIQQFSQRIQTYATSYQWDLMEAEALLQGRQFDVVSNRLMTARRVIERKVDELISIGDSATGLEGFINNSNVTAANVATGDWGNPSTTVDQILADVDSVISAVPTDTLESHQVSRVAVAPSAWRDLMSRRLGSASDTTIAEFIERAYPGVQFMMWNRLESAGAASTRRMIAFDASPDVAGALVPMEFRRTDPEFSVLHAKVGVLARCGGCVVRYPKGMRYGDAI